MKINDEVKQFLDESIQLELNISDLYQLFYAKYPIDSLFWWDLSLEEINHAALIRSINDLFLPEKILPSNEIANQTQKIHFYNTEIQERISGFKRDVPTRQEAFIFAVELENSFGEIHFDLFMNDPPESNVEKIFQKLNGENKDHARRISEYIRLNKI